MRVRGHILALAALSAMIAIAVPAQAPEPAADPRYDGPDIVVIARKLRRVRLNYATRGPFVTSCEAERSSGDPRIDRIMCAILKSCVAAGAREVDAARVCMVARIDSLEGQSTDTVLAAARTSPDPFPPVAKQPKADTPEIIVTGQVPDIVVTGSDPVMRGGLWRFRRTATLAFGGGSGARPANFTQCLPPGAIQAMLRRAAGETSPMPGSGHCGNIRVTFANGRISGSRSCVGTRDISRLTLTGRYDARRLMLNYNIEQDHDGVERATGSGWNPSRQVGYRWQVTATREGECPLRERLDQLDANEVVSALFSERGVTEGPDLFTDR